MGHDSFVRVLSRRDVESSLDLDELIEALAPAMTDLSSGRASVPLRVAALVPEQSGILGAMPGYLPSSNTLAAKLVSVFPHNDGRGLPTHQALIAVFDAQTGAPLAVMDGGYITATRTAAGSALATRLLARQDASVLAIVGSGVQAHAHARAIPRVRPVMEIRVAGRDAARAAALAKQLTEELGIPATAARGYEDAIRGADIVCATTHSPDPVVRREWLVPGTHVNSVGVNPAGGELDAETVRDSVVVVEWRPAALAPYPSGAMDLTAPIRDGVISEDHIHAEIGELLSGEKSGRTDDEQITLYKSVGVAVQDAAAAALVLAAAAESGAGVEVEL
jgi:alanine dehydrogenase